MKVFNLILSLFIALPSFAGIGPSWSTNNQSLASGDLYVFSIGIDLYSHTGIYSDFNFCRSDALAISARIGDEFNDLIPSPGEEHGLLKTYTLLNENANNFMIKEVFRTIAQSAKPEDHFIFFFAGVTMSSKDQEWIIPYYNIETDSSADSTAPISVRQLASWMENISCKNQLIISEAGNGENFARRLISNLFEDNAIIASESQRNRLILTTNGIGQESVKVCKSNFNGGYLASFLLQMDKIISVFNTPEKFEYHLIKEELKCDEHLGSKMNRIYSALYKESDFRWLLVEQQLELKNRGVEVEEIQDSNQTAIDAHIPQKYAIVISTNKYPYGGSSWKDLDNPRNDAIAVSQLLKDRYGFEIIRLHDMPKDSVTWHIKNLKRKVHESDKVLIFIAGHGYYDQEYNDGFLVFSDGLALNDKNDDADLDSYLPMAKLHNLVNGMPCKNVFIIFDVCFGASFDVFAQDLKLSDYSHIMLDGSLESFCARKDSLVSRIFIASGKGEVPDHWSMDLQHSPFAGKLIVALREEEEFFSPGKIYEYLEGNVTEPILKQFGTQHHPRGDFIIPVVTQN